MCTSIVFGWFHWTLWPLCLLRISRIFSINKMAGRFEVIKDTDFMPVFFPFQWQKILFMFELSVEILRIRESDFKYC